MSLLKSKSFWNGVLAAVIISAVCASSMAFAPEGMRLWKPYQPEQFGGQRRDADGVYGGIDAICWNLSKLKFGREAIHTPPLNLLTTGDAPIDTVSYITDIDLDFRFGTRVTVGNYMGHHGWRFTGYQISDITRAHENAALTWNSGIYLGVIDWINVMSPVVKISSTTTVTNLDLDYTYRTHPFKWGGIELYAGAKYWEFDNEFSHANAIYHNIYFYRNRPEGWLTLDGPSVTQVRTWLNETPPYALVELAVRTQQQVKNRMVGPNFGFDLTRRNKRWTFGTGGSVFLGMNNQSFTFDQCSEVSARELGNAATTNNRNQNFSPVGGAEEINLGGDPPNGGFQGLAIAEMVALQQQGTGLNPGQLADYYHWHRTRTLFSPGANLHLSAKWQWTDAFGIKFGFDSTIRSHVNDGGDFDVTRNMVWVQNPNYNPLLPLDPDGPLVSPVPSNVATPANPLHISAQDGYNISIRDKGSTVILYGFSIGLEIRR
ncbi:MAG: hypothetical protein FWE67_12670 [Planctomycetaceae bacterium]|nr:hypothetical protein [Planctomycetaceae bacterium]